jgi:ubiquinol-cytochrome c reductase cytochrome b subunit
MAKVTERKEAALAAMPGADDQLPEESQFPQAPVAERDHPWFIKPFVAFEDRTGIWHVVKPIIQHPIPPNTGWMYVFGSATLTTFIVQVVTGITLALFYDPSSAGAYPSLQFITNDLVFGNQLRAIHNFGAAAMVIFIGIHMIRVFLTGSFKFPREVNWLSGVILFILTITIAFTGQIMRWDQNGLWTEAILINQAGRVPYFGTWIVNLVLGGDTFGAQSFTRIVGLHMLWLPGIIIGVVAFHLYLVIKNGISEPPRVGRPVDPRRYRAWYDAMLRREGVPFWPDALWRDVAFSAALVTTLIVIAWTKGPPDLSLPPDPTIITATPRPDFYFLWYFGLLALSPSNYENKIIIGAPIALIIVLFLIPILGFKGERHPARRPWAVVFVLMTVFTVGFYTIEGHTAPWSPDYADQPLPASVVSSLTGPARLGADLFHEKGCEFCHNIAGQGGIRGPNLGDIGDKMTPEEMTIQISRGSTNMPAFGAILTTDQLNDLVAFLQTQRRTDYVPK